MLAGRQLDRRCAACPPVSPPPPLVRAATGDARGRRRVRRLDRVGVVPLRRLSGSPGSLSNDTPARPRAGPPGGADGQRRQAGEGATGHSGARRDAPATGKRRDLCAASALRLEFVRPSKVILGSAALGKCTLDARKLEKRALEDRRRSVDIQQEEERSASILPRRTSAI